MKKMLFCAAVAIAALASCSKTQVVYNDAPEEIAFKQITGAMTKATTEGYEDLNASIPLGVFAAYNVVADKTTGAEYFSNQEFTKESKSYWSGSTPQYYPLSGTLDFVGYAPYMESNVTYSFNGETTTTDDKILTISNFDNTGTQVDLLYSDYISGISKDAGDVNMKLNHALAKITINTYIEGTNGSSVTINSMTVTDTRQKGTMTVQYSQTNSTYSSVLKWSEVANSDKSDYTLHAYNDKTLTVSTTPTQIDGEQNIFNCIENASFYVIPSDQTSIVLSYKLSSNTNAPALTHTFTLNPVAVPTSTTTATNKWDAGKEYIYNITIENYEILFAAETKKWESEEYETSNENSWQLTPKTESEGEEGDEK